MKIFHVTSVHPPFDVRIFHKECRTLAQAGYDVTLLAQTDGREKAIDGVRVIGLPRIARRYRRPHLWRLIVGEVKRLKPDVVHLHDPELLLIVPFLRSARLVYDCHEPTAETMLVRRWIPHSLRCPVSRLVAFLEPVLARHIDAVVVTEDSHMELFQRCGCPVVLLYNYPLLSNLGFTRHSDGKTILHIGLLSEERGAGTMIQAMKHVVERVWGARLLLVGSFDCPADEIEICQMISDYGLEDAVVLVGWVPFSDLPKWFVQGDIGLVPWQTKEKFPPQIIPTKMFEYMSFGLPIVASNRLTIRRFLDGLDCGFLVRPGDPQELAEAIEYLLNCPAEAERMGENGRQAIEERYNWEAEGEKLIALYCQLA
jgi:glycosyltransferase involved in cell wall biosynthesis